MLTGTPIFEKRMLVDESAPILHDRVAESSRALRPEDHSTQTGYRSTSAEKVFPPEVLAKCQDAACQGNAFWGPRANLDNTCHCSDLLGMVDKVWRRRNIKSYQ